MPLRHQIDGKNPVSHRVFLCPENPQLGWGFSKAFSFGS
ncbi:hypothetical protein YPPY54_4179, partial [Yersinia pestis PY-54]